MLAILNLATTCGPRGAQKCQTCKARRERWALGTFGHWIFRFQSEDFSCCIVIYGPEVDKRSRKLHFCDWAQFCCLEMFIKVL